MSNLPGIDGAPFHFFGLVGYFSLNFHIWGKISFVLQFTAFCIHTKLPVKIQTLGPCYKLI